jgi:hypothetical protein
VHAVGVNLIDLSDRVRVPRSPLVSMSTPAGEPPVKPGLEFGCRMSPPTLLAIADEVIE